MTTILLFVVIFAGFHNVAHLSKPILFTGASTLFLLVYGTLWTFHDSTEVRNASPHLEPDEDISFKEEIQICNVSFQVLCKSSRVSADMLTCFTN